MQVFLWRGSGFTRLQEFRDELFKSGFQEGWIAGDQSETISKGSISTGTFSAPVSQRQDGEWILQPLFQRGLEWSEGFIQFSSTRSKRYLWVYVFWIKGKCCASEGQEESWENWERAEGWDCEQCRSGRWTEGITFFSRAICSILKVDQRCFRCFYFGRRSAISWKEIETGTAR